MRRNRYAILVMGMLTFLMLGFMYMWSNFQGSIQADLGFSTDSAAKWAYTICVVFFSVGIMVDGALGNRMSTRFSSMLGTMLITAGFLISSVLTPATAQLIYVVYGIGVGLGAGLCYNVWLSNVLPWFGDKRGTASGILLLGMGLTGLTLMKFVVAPWLQNDALGWRFCFRAIGLTTLTVGLIGLLFIQKPAVEASAGGQTQSGGGLELNPVEMLKTGAFWCFTGWKSLLFGIGLSIAGAVAGVVRTGAPSGLDGAAVAALATNSVAVFSLCNGLSRPIAGVVFDRLKAVKTMTLVAILLTLASLGLCFSYGHGVTATIVLLALVAFCYGASTTMGPTFISSVFGQKHYRANQGIQALFAIPFTILGSQGVSAVYDATGSYRGFFIIMAVCGVVSLALALLCGPSIRSVTRRGELT